MNSGKHITYEAQLGSEDMGSIELKELKELGNKIRYVRGDAALSMLVKNLDGKNMQPLLKRLDPQSGSDGLYAHNDSQEFGYVASSEFDLMIEDEVYRLRQGDSFYFSSSRPHGFINNGEKPAEIMWVIGPPTY